MPAIILCHLSKRVDKVKLAFMFSVKTFVPALAQSLCLQFRPEINAPSRIETSYLLSCWLVNI
jgi:hypothetical protein